MRFSQYLPVFAAFAIAAVLSLGAASISARAIEDISRDAVAKQLKVGGFDWVEIQTDGLQVVLTGSAPSESEQLAAQRAAGHVVDPARVLNVMTVEQAEAIPAPEFSIEILRNAQGISLIGLVPSSWDREQFIRRLERSAGSGSVADFLEQADYAKPESWDDAVAFALEALDLLERSKISLTQDEIRVDGLVDSEVQKRRLERQLGQDSPDTIDVVLNIAAPRPVITPFTVRFVIDERGPHFDACSAETEAGKSRIEGAARALGVENPQCRLGLGSPSAQWAAAVEEGLRALSELGSGTITFSDGDVTLNASQGTSEANFDKVVGELEAELPASFRLHANLPEPEVADQNAEAAQFTVTRSPEGLVQVRGRIADERSRTAAEALAHAAFGTQSVYSALRVDENLPEGWSTRALAAIDALAELNFGSAVMTDSSLTIKGQTGSETARADIAGLLADRLGANASYEIDVEYVRKLDPVLNLPTPEECVARANTILASTKIDFAPGSAEVDEGSMDTLDRIARAFDDCEGMEIEIGGHTDSQGREEMNLGLSQSRANSVLDAMLARRVVDVKFTAQGYGETQPIADNDTEEGREANRRIEFRLLSPVDETGSSATEAADDDGTAEAEDAASDESTDASETQETDAETTDDDGETVATEDEDGDSE